MPRRKARRCGYCSTADAVRHGTRYGVQKGGEVTYLSTQAALDHLASLCRCPDPETGRRGPAEVHEIRRPGQRILRAGTPVFVQLKRRPGTRRDRGTVLSCFEDGTVRIHIPSVGPVTVPADDFVKARNKNK